MKLIHLATALAITVSATAPALADTIRCESQNGRERYCPGNTRGGVSIQTQLSGSSCYQGDTWGYDNRGVWVSGGCRAVFQNGYGGGWGGSGGWNGNNDNNNNHHGSGDGAAAAVAIGAVLGAVIIASAANKNKQGGYQDYYNSGCDAGKKDRRNGQSAYYGRHGSSYDSRNEQAFASGYNQCWQN